MYKCFFCGNEITIKNKHITHKLCDKKRDSLYALSTLLENKIITFDEYRTILSDIKGMEFISNYNKHNKKWN